MRNFLHHYCLLFCLFLISFSIQAKNFITNSESKFDSPLNEQTTPKVASYNGEFVELFNPSIESVDLSGWTLRGGSISEAYIFPVYSIMRPKSYLSIAYQFSNSAYTMDQQHIGVVGTTDDQIRNQEKNLLSNTGEAIFLRNANGVIKDSIFYDRNNPISNINKFSADIAMQSQLERTTSTVSKSKQNTANIASYLPGVGVSYAYDVDGNLTERKLVTVPAKTAQRDSNIMPQTDVKGEQKITIYPNPTQGLFAVFISKLDIKQKNYFYLYSLSGTKLIENTITEDLTDVDISNYPAGIYLLDVTLAGKVSKWKIIKQ